MTTGLVFNVQRYSTDDGPGIRTTVFLKGCPLSCTWCHNPEGISPRPEVVVVADRCVDCGECASVCPVLSSTSPTTGIPLRGAVAAAAEDRPLPAAVAGTDDCLTCGRCVEACTSGARRMVGVERTAEDLLRELERDRSFYESTGGGVTFSGGEPLAQGAFLLECLEGCRERGFHTAVDTSGHAGRELMLAVARSARLILFDLKTLDPERHLKSTGVPLAPIIENLHAVDEAGVALVIRLPLVPGVTDGEDNLRALADVVNSLSHKVPVRLLPFHRTATDKYRRLSREWQHDGLAPLSRERTEEVVEFLRRLGVDARTGRE